MTFPFQRRIQAWAMVLGLGLSACTAGETAPPSGVSSTSPSAEPSTTASATAPPTSTPVPLGLTWSSDAFPGLVAAIANDEGSLVAVGRDADGLAAWTSADGDGWQRHPVPDPTFIDDEMVDIFGPQIFDGTRMGPIRRLGDTLFSFGTFVGFNDFYRPVAWSSADGMSWEFVESDSEFYETGAITDVETFSDGLVAARSTGLGLNSAVWTWGPGASWVETSIQSHEGASLVRMDIAVVGDQVVVVGVRAERDSLQNPGAYRSVGWTSPDGEEWTELVLPDNMDMACGVAATPGGGFAVMGTLPDGEGAVWTTSDGSDLERADLGTGFCGESPITLAGNRLAVSTATGNEGAKLWLSADGRDWVAQDLPAIQSVYVAELNGELHILGTPVTDEPFLSTHLHGVP